MAAYKQDSLATTIQMKATEEGPAESSTQKIVDNLQYSQVTCRCRYKV